MSEAYSVESVALNSALIGRDLRRYGSLKLILTVRKSSRNTGHRPKSIATLPKSTSQNSQKLIFSQEVSHVKTFQLQGKEEELSKGKDQGFGKSMCVPLGKYDRISQSLKTYQHLLLEDSATYLQTLPKKGMMQNGRIYLLVNLERHIHVKECSLWPTPTASESKGGGKGQYGE